MFVAGFIGSPSMNFLPARLEGDTIRLPFGDAPLPGRLRARLQGDRQTQVTVRLSQRAWFSTARSAPTSRCK